MKRVLVIGGGAAGLIAAGTAAKNGARVTVLERNPRPARKVMITGKGRCNVTNDSDIPTLIANVPTNGRFLYSAFHAFGPDDVRGLLAENGVETKVEREKLMFRIKANINADLLRKYIHNVKTGLPGVAWVKIDPEADWKDSPVKGVK